jgi:hypothetical protein
MTDVMPRLTGVAARHALDPKEVADLAREYHRRWVEDEDFEKFKTATHMYDDCWASYTGYPLVMRWDLAADKEPLFIVALRVLMIKAAVYTLTNGDGKAAELALSLPVDEMTHAMVAQPTLWFDMSVRTGVRIVHETDYEELSWEPGDFTHQCLVLAFGEELNPRYWFGVEETKRRLQILQTQHELAGMRENGRSHDLTFGLDRELEFVGS